MPGDAQKIEVSAVPVGTRVLVLDDSRAIQRLLARMLDRWGYEVTTCGDPEEALEILRDPGFSIIVSDWIMPGLTGPEFCRRFRALDRESYGYIILLTSKNDKGSLAHALDAGADDFASKPVDAAEMRARLRAGNRIVAMQRELVRQNRVSRAALSELKTLYDAVDRDLLEARRLQQSLLRETFRRIGDTAVALHLHPSGHIGGDLVGFYHVEADRVGVFALDVSGHGVASALVTARLAGLLSAAAPEQSIALSRDGKGNFLPLPPEQIAGRLNTLMTEEMETDLYFTLCLADVDLTTGRVAMVQAGHPHPALIRADGRVEFLGQGGLPVGLLPGATYERFEATVDPGDRLLLYSDGVTECEPGQGTGMLDEAGLVEILGQISGRGAERFLPALVEQLGHYAGGLDFDDDVSMLLLEVGAIDRGG